MEPSLKSRILSYIDRCTRHDSEAWVHKGTIEREALMAGYLGDNAARRLRELHAEGKLMRKEDASGTVLYRIL